MSKKIIEWCERKNVNVSDIFRLAHHSERECPTFVIRANIDFADYKKTKNPNFWPNGSTVRDWVARTERNTKLKRSEES